MRLFTRGGSRGARCWSRPAALLAGTEAQAAAPKRLTPKQARALRAAVRGRVLEPTSSGYNAARVVFNRRYDHVKPPAIVQVEQRRGRPRRRPLGRPLRHPAGHPLRRPRLQRRLDELQRGRGRPPTPRPHHRTGRPRHDRPRRAPGDVYTTLAAKGVTIPAGSCPTVGLGGLVLGGGMGLAGRAFGLTLDRVTSFDVVTADGRRRRVERRRRPVLGPERRRRELRDRHRGPPQDPPRHQRRVLQHHLPARGADEALHDWDAFAPQRPERAHRDPHARRQRRRGVRPVPGLGADAAQPDRPLQGAPTTGSADYLTVQRRWAGASTRRAPPSPPHPSTSTSG